MKKAMTCILFAATSLSHASEIRRFANADCQVEMETPNNGILLYISQGEQTAIVGVTRDRSRGTISGFCDEPSVAATGDQVRLFCDAHQNGREITRGNAEIDFRSGLTSVSVTGQVKGFFGWKTDTRIDCRELTEKL